VQLTDSKQFATALKLTTMSILQLSEHKDLKVKTIITLANIGLRQKLHKFIYQLLPQSNVIQINGNETQHA